MNLKKLNTLFLTGVLSLGIMTACGQSNTNENVDNKNNETNVNSIEKTVIDVALLKGPTGVGGVKLIEDDEELKTANDYNFTIANSPDEITAKLINGEVDVAAVPTNLASVLYNKTNGEIQLSALNTLGVLYIVENGNEIQSIKDLEGKKIVSSGKGSVPEYVLNYILEKNNVQNVQVDYKTEHTEVVTALSTGEATIVLLPEPNVTTALSTVENSRIALDITKEWDSISEGSVLSMGGLVVRKEFLNENKEAFDIFLDEYENSINFVNENVDEAAALVEKYGIIPKAELAKKAIPNCNIVYIDNTEMKDSIIGFYDVLYNYEPKSVGGKLPDENFYYISEQ